MSTETMTPMGQIMQDCQSKGMRASEMHKAYFQTAILPPEDRFSVMSTLSSLYTEKADVRGLTNSIMENYK